MNFGKGDPDLVYEEAKRQVESKVVVPDGYSLEWTGEYFQSKATRLSMLWILPPTIFSALILSFLAFRRFEETLLLLTPIPFALAGGAVCQWIMDEPFSLAVLVGYISCIGMSVTTSMIMLVYLRNAVEESKALGALTIQSLHKVILSGATSRLRPKLMTEVTLVLSLVPLLWSNGIGADVIRPMAAPVLGGILIADEAVDLLIPILFFYFQRRKLMGKEWTQESEIPCISISK